TLYRGHVCVFLLFLFLLSLPFYFVLMTVNYFLDADFPAFLLNNSPSNLIPFPLYGSGGRCERILAQTKPNNSLSAENNVTLGFCPFCCSADALISFGNKITTG